MLASRGGRRKIIKHRGGRGGASGDLPLDMMGVREDRRKRQNERIWWSMASEKRVVATH